MKRSKNWWGAAACSLVFIACNAQPPPRTVAGEASTSQASLSNASSSTPRPSAEHESDEETKAGGDDALLALLPSAKVDLARGIAQAESQGARAISAKFELDSGKLSLSVYTAKKGIELDAEHNVLTELSGDPTQSEWNPNEEVFADAKHLTRASYHLTLVQRSRMSLAVVIAKALARQSGQVYSIEPGVHERSPIFHVLIASPGGGHVQVDVESGA